MRVDEAPPGLDQPTSVPIRPMVRVPRIVRGSSKTRHPPPPVLTGAAGLTGAVWCRGAVAGGGVLSVGLAGTVVGVEVSELDESSVYIRVFLGEGAPLPSASSSSQVMRILVAGSARGLQTTDCPVDLARTIHLQGRR